MEKCDVCKERKPDVAEDADKILRCNECLRKRKDLQKKYHIAPVGSNSDPCKNS